MLSMLSAVGTGFSASCRKTTIVSGVILALASGAFAGIEDEEGDSGNSADKGNSSVKRQPHVPPIVDDSNPKHSRSSSDDHRPIDPDASSSTTSTAVVLYTAKTAPRVDGIGANKAFRGITKVVKPMVVSSDGKLLSSAEPIWIEVLNNTYTVFGYLKDLQKERKDLQSQLAAQGQQIESLQAQIRELGLKEQQIESLQIQIRELGLKEQQVEGLQTQIKDHTSSAYQPTFIHGIGFIGLIGLVGWMGFNLGSSK